MTAGNERPYLMLSDREPDTFPLATDETIVGRTAGCDIVLDDPKISRRHASVSVRLGAVFLTDLGSSNGTFVNGRRIEEAVELHDGDRLAFAGLEATFHAAPSVEPITLPPRPAQVPVSPAPALSPPNTDHKPLVPTAALERFGGEPVLLTARTITIGRDVRSDVALDDPYVSMHHARIANKDDRFILTDLKSANGTFVNDEPVTRPTVLEPGDEVRFGRTDFVFRRLATVSKKRPPGAPRPRTGLSGKPASRT